MKIPIKLKRDELHSLVAMLENNVDITDCTDRLEAIVNVLILKFYLVLKKKSIMLDKSSLTINVEPETAMAFVEYFTGYPIDCYSHAANVVQKMIADCDRGTAGFF